VILSFGERNRVIDKEGVRLGDLELLNLEDLADEVGELGISEENS
jgi:hypothetical protein